MDLILYNPKSKNSRGNIETHRLIRKYRKKNQPFRLKSVLKVEDLKKFLNDRPHLENIILLGGDGTVNQLVNNLYDFTLKQDVFIKRNGSGNDFLKTLKTQDKKPQYIIEATLNKSRKKYFINSMGYGLDGMIVNFVDTSKKKGKLTYFWSSIKGIIKYKPTPLSLDIDGESYNFDKTYLVSINNGMFIGGGMHIAPDAKIYTKDLDVIVVHSINKLLLLFIFLSVYFKQHLKFKKYVFFKKGRHIKATYKTPQIAQLDGEVEKNIKKIRVKATNKQIHLRSYHKKKSA
ncbi:MAG: hypothetical protein K9L74_01435 [Candidatus Izimaplasma sp.]|nr:hypothetical protein [Candidatus Izimaplasma bacterium]